MWGPTTLLLPWISGKVVPCWSLYRPSDYLRLETWNIGWILQFSGNLSLQATTPTFVWSGKVQRIREKASNSYTRPQINGGKVVTSSTPILPLQKISLYASYLHKNSSSTVQQNIFHKAPSKPHPLLSTRSPLLQF